MTLASSSPMDTWEAQEEVFDLVEMAAVETACRGRSLHFCSLNMGRMEVVMLNDGAPWRNWWWWWWW